MMETWNVYPYHFWLDAYCPSAGEKYKWRDGTETDYYGPENGMPFLLTSMASQEKL